MIIFILISGILISCSFNIYQYIKQKKQFENDKQEYLSKIKEDLKKEIEQCKEEIEVDKEFFRLKHIQALHQFDIDSQQLEEKQNKNKILLEQLNLRLKEAENNYEALLKEKEEKLKLKYEIEFKQVEQNYQNKLNKQELEFQNQIKFMEQICQEKQTQAKEQLKQCQIECSNILNNYETQAKEQIEQINGELYDYKQKVNAVNEAILRQRAINEQKDFYRICLSQKDKQDISYLLSIVDDLRSPQILYKLIWSEYIQKPFNTMLKNIFQNKECRCVIYKITNLNTGEVYIGKTKADVSKRWTEHIKTSLLIGTVSRSKIHDALYKHWDEFTFEVVEKVSNESLLSSREKYYINFYESNIYGYNMNSGG